MAEPFYLDKPGVERNASGVRSMQQGLSDAVGNLREVLTRRHGCWGTDDIGKGFGDNYVPGETEALTYTDELVTGLGNYADGLINFSDHLSQTDEDNAAQIDHLDAEGIREQQREQEAKQNQQNGA